MKTNFFHFSHGVNQSFLFLTLLLLGLGITPHAWAWYNLTNAKVYYDPTAAGWEEDECQYVQFIPDKGNRNEWSSGWGSAGLSMKHIANTNLWFWTGSWGDGYVNYLRFASTKTTGWGWKEYQDSNDRVKDNTDCCGYDGGLGCSVNNQHVLFSSTGASKAAAINKTTLSGYADLNKKQTVVLMISTDNGSTYTQYDSDWEGNSIAVNRYTMDDNETAGSHNKTLDGTEADKKYASAVITSTITFTATPNSNFTFAGWATDDKGPDNDKTNASYSYTVSGTKTIYAYFKENTNTITLVGCTASSTTAGPITTGTATAKEPAGKEVTGFNKSGEEITFTGTMADKAISFNATAAGTVTAVFAYKTPTIEVASTATYTLGGAAIKLNPQYSNLAEGATYAWTCTAASGTGASTDKVTFSDATAANPNISASTAGEYTITLTATNGTGEGSKTSEVKTITLTASAWSGNDCGTCFQYTQPVQ